jgi:hypothetical protein
MDMKTSGRGDEDDGKARAPKPKPSVPTYTLGKRGLQGISRGMARKTTATGGFD